MLDRKTTSKRLATFSDGVFAVIVLLIYLNPRMPELFHRFLHR